MGIQELYLLSGKTSCRQMSWSLEVREIGCYDDRIALKFDRYLGRTIAEVCERLKNLIPNFTASRLHEILRQDVLPLSV